MNNGKPVLFNVYLKSASSFKEIRHTELLNDDKKTQSTLRTIQQSYSKAPYFNDVFSIIKKVFEETKGSISDFAIQSIKVVYDYLGLNLNYKLSSEFSSQTKGQNRVERLVNITKYLGYKNYINVTGGMRLYNKEEFSSYGINLYFNKPLLIPYYQFNDSDFHPYLSIIDVMMFCSKEQIIKMIRSYEII